MAKSNHDCTGADGGGVLSIYYAGTCNVMEDADESLAYLFMPGLLYGWCIAVICYAILYQFWKVCVQIGKDNSFSKENAKCFRNISHFALLLAVVWFAGNCFSGNLSGQAARNQYFYDHRSFAFGHDICFGSGIITSGPESLRIKNRKMNLRYKERQMAIIIK